MLYDVKLYQEQVVMIKIDAKNLFHHIFQLQLYVYILPPCKSLLHGSMYIEGLNDR